ncbi:beta strand repeat-containing protein [Caballeronia mineralivorans]|uniref:beta strand repeat-containing protein n=1 Tax=Caballeronia mineralivorans TaxID=2010198 RepID=UPI0009E25A01|nr:matrixin family metalloprotease [Caballeronia mineralivorans]
MGGITVVQATTNAVNVSNSVSGTISTIQGYVTGNASYSDLANSAANLVSSVTGLSSSPGFSTISSATGVVSGTVSYNKDLQAYNQAVADGNDGEATQAALGLVSDALSIASSAALGVALIDPLSAPAMLTVSGGANVFSNIASGAQAAYGAANWLNNFLNDVDTGLTNGAVDELINSLSVGVDDSNGDQEIIIPGQSGDTLAETPLSGNAFEYSEENSEGTVTSGVQLAMNGNADSLTVVGPGVVADVGGFNIDLTSNSSATLNGGGNSVSSSGALTGSTLTLEGTGTDADTVSLSDATDLTVLLGDATTEAGFVSTSATVSSLNGGGIVTGSTGDNLNILGVDVTLNATGGQYSLTGNGDTANASNSSISIASGNQATVSGSDNTVTASASDSITLDGSGDSATAGTGSTITVNGQSDSINASGSSIDLAANSQATISGTGDSVVAGQSDVIDLSNATITLTAGSQVTIEGSGDTIIGAANDTITVGGSGDIINGVAGDTVDVSGAGQTVDMTGGQVDMATNTQVNVTGSDDGINEAAGDSLGAYGGGNTIDTTAGALTVVGSTNGSFDLVNANGDQFGGTTANGQQTGIFINANSQVNEVGSNDGISESAGDAVGVYGGGNTIDTTSDALTVLGDTNGAFDLVNGSGDQIGVATADGQGSGIILNGNTQANVVGSNDGISESAGDAVGVYGGGNTIDTTSDALTVLGDTNGAFDLVNGSGDQIGVATADGQGSGIVLNGNTQANVVGSNDGISESAGDAVGVYGGGNTIDTTSDALTVLGDTNGAFDTVNGSGDQLGQATADGQGSGIILNGNTQADINGSNDGIGESAGDAVGVYGGGNTIDTTSDALTVLGDTNGAFDTVNGSGDQLGQATADGQGSGIILNGNTQADINGSNDGIGESAGDAVGVYGGGNTIDTTSDALTVLGDTNGSFDTVNGSGDQLGQATADGQGSGIVLNGNTQANVNGSNDGISESVGDSMGAYGGGNTIDTTAGALTYVSSTDGDADTINASGDTLSGTTANGQGAGISVGTDAQADIDGSNDQTSGGDGSSVTAFGSDDSLNGQQITSGTTGDIADNGAFSDSSGSDDSGGSDSGGGDSGGGYYGYYGFAGNQTVVQAALGSDIGSIAQYDLSIGNQAGATAAEVALHQAQEMADATPTSGTGTSVDSNNKWAGEVVTWSLASDVGSQYDAEVQNAFATWAAASGITFEEVTGSSQSDIQIAFSDLNTSTTGVVGYTDYQVSNGQISDAVIQLEDPSQDALVSGADGQQTYAGTDATLSQVLLHEIGHALGLADNSDQDSIMYYELTSSNQTLDSTDVAGIQSLYGSTSSAVQSSTAGTTTSAVAGQISVDHQLGQLIAGMASFNPQAAGNTSLTQDDHAHHHTALAASAH